MSTTGGYGCLLGRSYPPSFREGNEIEMSSFDNNRDGDLACRVGVCRAWWLAVATMVAVGLALPVTSLAALPDGRVYEEVSPANKDGNVVLKGFFGLASEDGDAVVFVGTGAMGSGSSGSIDDSVSRRSASGWMTSSAAPRALGTASLLSRPPLTLIPSQGFSSFLFGSGAPYVSAEPLDEQQSVNIFLSDNPAIEPIWLGRPTATSTFNPVPLPGQNNQLHDYLIAGTTPSLSTVYFTYSGTLIPQDASRTPNVDGGRDVTETDAWGFYEWSAGKLSEAGVLPDGTLDPFGAVPAAIAGGPVVQRNFSNPFDQAQTLDNEISTDGSRAFFVSPDPVASTVTDKRECELAGPCTNATPELYVRKTALDGTKSTVLVSQSQLPGQEGEPAPDGPVKIADATHNRLNEEPAGDTYVYASPDGSQAFFASVDQLTSDAPNDGTVKEYDFNVETGALTYLSGVSGPIVVSSHDGSSFVFENTATIPAELDLWRNSVSGGRITTIAPMPVGPSDVDGARATTDGSVFVFRTNSPLPGGFNNGEGVMQVYRYEAATNKLDCVSCPPAGVTPSGDAEVSYDNAANGAGEAPNGANDNPMSTLDTRVISADGDRVFFDTPDPLVPQDSNGTRDVYEWEDGKVYLISTGTSSEESELVDSSASGDDVFFRTAQGIAPGDKDTGYDVYDARVPRPGDNPPPSVLPCQGDVCQGPPSVPSLLGAPPSALFNGAGNVTLAETKPAGVTPRTRAQKLAKALRACRVIKGEDKRHRCEVQAKRAYGPPPKAKKTNRRVK
jgi:hypothetical protein